MFINKLQALDELNKYFFDLIYNFGSNNFLILDLKVFLAKYLPYFLVVILLYLIFSGKIKKQNFSFRIKLFFVIEIILGVILARGILVEFIRFFIPLYRPFDVLNIKALINESGVGMPSGHAAFFSVLSIILFFWNKKLGIIYFILGLLNGLARISVGVHWPMDIFIGVMVGIFSAILIQLIFKPQINKFKFD